MNVLITGISGFLGTHLCNKLKGYCNVYGVTGISGKRLDISNLNLYDIENLKKIKAIPDIVIMCHAAISSGTNKEPNLKLYEANVLFTERVAAQFPHAYYIYLSTTSVYGQRDDILTELSATNPSSEYAISKLWGEKIMSNLHSHSVLRLSSLYGEGMKENTIIPLYVNHALYQNKIEVWGAGKRKQNYIYVMDAIQYIEAIMHIRPSGIFLGVSSTQTTNLELAEKISHYTGAEISFSGQDKSIDSVFDNSKTKKQLQIEQKTNLGVGLKKYTDWKKKQF